MIITAICLTFIVFFLTNLHPNLEKLAKTQGNMRMTDEQVATWLENRGYTQSLVSKYGQWLGVFPGYVIEGTDGEVRARCAKPGMNVEDAPSFCGVLQGDWGFSTVFKEPVWDIVSKRLALTGKLMFWVMMLMVPAALLLGVLAGMREGSRTDRTLSTISIASSCSITCCHTISTICTARRLGNMSIKATTSFFSIPSISRSMTRIKGS